MAKRNVETILISDVHLGSDSSHPEELRAMLEGYDFRRLIIVGDLFQDMNPGRLHRQHWKLLSYLRKLTDPSKGVEVIWIEGNHDWKILNLLGALIGLEVVDEYHWTDHGVRHLAIHGHQFDIHLPKSRFLNWIGQTFLLFSQRHFSTRFVKWILHTSNRFSRSIENVREGAIRYAREKGARRVFCGHTHRADSYIHGAVDGTWVDYYNLGSWCDEEMWYVTITDGIVTPKLYIPEKKSK